LLTRQLAYHAAELPVKLRARHLRAFKPEFSTQSPTRPASSMPKSPYQRRSAGPRASLTRAARASWKSSFDRRIGRHHFPSDAHRAPTLAWPVPSETSTPPRLELWRVRLDVAWVKSLEPGRARPRLLPDVLSNLIPTQGRATQRQPGKLPRD
jgi:hypothetical protein